MRTSRGREDPESASGVTESDPDYIVVRTSHDVQRLIADIVSERDEPIVGLTQREDGHEPVLAAREVRALLGPGVRIYLIPEEDLLREFRRAIGPRLTLERAAARIWWPGASVRCDPDDHPLVVALEGEAPADTLQEFSHRLDLSRPYVREQIALLEDACAFLEHELDSLQERNHQIAERLRDTQIDCHNMRTRAEAAEARLAAGEAHADSP
jgi:hypothetical protein